MDTKFQINQIRQDKIIYAIEAVAVNITALVAVQFFNLISSLVPAGGFYFYYVSIAIMALAVLYTIAVLLFNLKRLGKIKKLEASL